MGMKLSKERFEEMGKVCFGKLYDGMILARKGMKTFEKTTCNIAKRSYEYVHLACIKVNKAFF